MKTVARITKLFRPRFKKNLGFENTDLRLNFETLLYT